MALDHHMGGFSCFSFLASILPSFGTTFGWSCCDRCREVAIAFADLGLTMEVELRVKERSRSTRVVWTSATGQGP